MLEFTVTDDPNQQFSVFLNNQRVTFRLWWATVTDRWSFDLSIDDLPVITGRRIVTNVDLIRRFNLDIGSIFCVAILPGAVPNRAGLPSGACRLYHVTQAEIDAAISS
jgi:hypothetical protein